MRFLIFALMASLLTGCPAPPPAVPAAAQNPSPWQQVPSPVEGYSCYTYTARNKGRYDKFFEGVECFPSQPSS